MKDKYIEYLTQLYEYIPEYIYEGALSLFFIGTLLILSFTGFRKGWRRVLNLLLVEYIFLVYCSTVIFRDTNDTVKLNSISIDYYKGIITGGLGKIDPEMLMNVLVFAPIGMLASLSIKELKWWYPLVLGCGISISIELLQFVLKRGTTEVGDVLHNTLGCLIGIGLYYLLHVIWLKTRGMCIINND